MPSLRSGLPPESLVFVEADRQTVWMRWAWGTVGAPQAPAERTLAEFDSTEDILFRVRVTAPGTGDFEHGLLLAEADRIRLRGPEETEENRDTIFPVVPTERGDELWRIVYVEGHRDYDDAASDFSRWVRFAVEVLGVGEPPKVEDGADDADEVDIWVANAVAAFSRKHGLLGKFEAFLAEGGS